MRRTRPFNYHVAGSLFFLSLSYSDYRIVWYYIEMQKCKWQNPAIKLHFIIFFLFSVIPISFFFFSTPHIFIAQFGWCSIAVSDVCFIYYQCILVFVCDIRLSLVSVRKMQWNAAWQCHCGDDRDCRCRRLHGTGIGTNKSVCWWIAYFIHEYFIQMTSNNDGWIWICWF